MERLEFNDIADLSDLLYELASEEESVVTVVLFYDKAQELIRWLLQYDDIDIGHIDFKHEDYGYDGEYYITLDTDLVLDVEPVKKNSDYTCIDTDALLLDGDVNSRIAVINTDCMKFELVFEEENCFECDEHCEDCELNDFMNFLEYISSIIDD